MSFGIQKLLDSQDSRYHQLKMTGTTKKKPAPQECRLNIESTGIAGMPAKHRKYWHHRGAG